MRVLVCGGRDYNDAKTVQGVLDRFHEETPFSCVIHGAARGADTLAGLWAKHNAVPVEVCVAAWSRYGRAAGMIRNEQMLREGRPDLVIAFPGGVGTSGMVRIARQAGVRVETVGQSDRRCRESTPLEVENMQTTRRAPAPQPQPSRQRDEVPVRLTGLFSSRRRGLYVGTARPDDIRALGPRLRKALDSGLGLTFFLWSNGKDEPAFTLTADVANPQPEKAEPQEEEAAAVADDDLPF